MATQAPARDARIESPPARRTSPWPALLVGGVVLAGVALRFITRSDLWLDEALSVNIARLPLSQLHTALRHDGAPPLYYLLLHVWTSAFGTTDVAVRALSGVAPSTSITRARSSVARRIR